MRTSLKGEAALGDFLELLAVVADAAAGAAHGEGGADDEGEAADLFGDLAGFVDVVGDTGAGHVEADLLHGFLEELAVFALPDGFGVGADHLDVVLLQDAGVEEGHGGVERGLAAEGGEEGVGLFADDDFFDDLGGDGLDVGAVGELRVGHDGGRVGVDEDDAVAFLAQGLAGLDAGVVEFAGLADDDGAGADEEDGFEVGAFGHGGRIASCALRAPGQQSSPGHQGAGSPSL